MKALVWIFSSIVIITLYSKAWYRWVEGKIHLFIEMSQRISVEGETIEVWTVLENQSWLPVPWFKLVVYLPKGIYIEENGKEQSEIEYTTYLFPRQRVKRKHVLHTKSRGLHKLTKTEAHFHDGIGLSLFDETLPLHESFITTPKWVIQPEIFFQLKELIGVQAVKRWFQEDPSRLTGIRPYQQGDVFKSIHWQATARTGQLMTKQYEPSSEAELYVVLNHQIFHPYSIGGNSDIIDEQCRWAAAIFQEAEEQGYTYGLLTNALWEQKGGFSILPEGQKIPLEKMMESLGRIHSHPVYPFVNVLRKIPHQIAVSSVLVIFTVYWDTDIAVEVEQLVEEGYTVIILTSNYTIEQMGDLLLRISVIPIFQEEWTDLLYKEVATG